MRIGNKVFLGGTCNESNWRERLISKLKIDYFNPVVDDWSPECQAEEERQKKICNFMLYVITPLMKGTFSIVEVVDDSNKKPASTIFCVLEDDSGKFFDKAQAKSLNAVENLVEKNGVVVLDDLDEVAEYLNSFES